jgi:hypothetical protein
MILPRPPQFGQPWVLTICPNKLCRTVLTAPAPPHVLHWLVFVPPTPSQTEHPLTICTLTSRSASNAASRNVTCTSTSASLPRPERECRAEEGAEGALAELVAEEGLEDVLEAAERVSAGAGGSGPERGTW